MTEPNEETSTTWVPAFEGQRPPFQPGNAVGRQFEAGNDVGRQFEAGHELSTLHGANSPRKVDPLAADLLAAVLADDATPAHAKSAASRLELAAMCRAEAQVQLVTAWLTTQADPETGVPDLGEPRVHSAYIVLHRAETRAANGRTRLGLNPMAAARLGKNVAQGQVAQADLAMRMAEVHAAEERAVARLKAEGWQPPTARLKAEGWQPPTAGASADPEIDGLTDADGKTP